MFDRSEIRYWLNFISAQNEGCSHDCNRQTLLWRLICITNIPCNIQETFIETTKYTHPKLRMLLNHIVVTEIYILKWRVSSRTKTEAIWRIELTIPLLSSEEWSGCIAIYTLSPTSLKKQVGMDKELETTKSFSIYFSQLCCEMKCHGHIKLLAIPPSFVTI